MIMDSVNKILIVVSFALLCACSTETSNDTRPNILFIVADDLGFTDLGAFGSEIPTPNIDELAFQGVRLTNFHTSYTCQATRVMMMASTGVSGALELRPPMASRERANRLSLNWAILPELLQEAGYETYMTGKWDLGLEDGYTPATRGFDRSFVQVGASASYFAEVLWGNYSLYELDGERVEYEALPDDFYATNYYTDKMIEFIKANEGAAPWFAYVPYTAPHWPLQVPEESLSRFAGSYDAGYDALREERVARAGELGVIPGGATLVDFTSLAPRWDELTDEQQQRYARTQELYAAMVENLDINVGRLIDLLRTSGQLENTVIVFTSDHGASTAEFGHTAGLVPWQGGPIVPDFIDNRFDNWGRQNSFVDHGLGFGEAASAPLEGAKGNLSEGGLRAASFVYYPAAVSGGVVNGSFMTILDILPTFLEIAESEHPGAGEYKGRQINGIRGRSFWPHMTGVSDTVHLPGDTVGWSQGERGALIRGDYKIINVPPGRSVEKTVWQLYDISTDPGERDDLAIEMPDLVLDMVAVWEADWR
ncbi:MAG: sulfatase-like hydrolase/transferase [Candidatus Rariloculaceae bacterium]